MGKQDNVIRLVLIEDAVEDAEQLVSFLRNGGIAVRPTRAESLEHLAEFLKTQPVDLVLANAKSKQIPLAKAAATVLQSGRDVPVLALVSGLTDDMLVQAHQDGATRIALRARPEHLVVAVKREFENVSMRRSTRRMEALLKESERRCTALLDSSRDPICFIHEGMHVRANQAYLDMFGFEEQEEIEGTPILDMIAPDAAASFKELLKRLSKGEKPPGKLEIKAQRPDGVPFDAMMEFTEATYEGEPCHQITFRRQQTGMDPKELEKLRSQDLVTGLYNRQFVLAELDRAVTDAASGKDDLAFLLLEPDNYKTILDQIGLGNADVLLSDMAQTVKAASAASDVAARFSDSSFAILLRDVSHDDASARARVLQKAFEEHIFEVSNKSLTVNVSVGMVLMGEKIANADSILGHASSALKSAQAKGGRSIEIYDPAAEDKADAQAERERLEEVNHALKHNGFVLFFQPIISLQGAEGEYYEILLRMQDKNGKEILPGGFFPVAEKNNLLPSIDRWVIANAIKQLAEREKVGHKSTFFIKISPPSLDDATLLPWIASHLKTHRLRGDALVFEMPESKVVTHMKPVRNFQKGLEQLHCHFALEQFGSGLNSFQLLKHVEAKYLKVDRTYMAELPKSKESQAKVKEICDQARTQGKITIAEFVEDAASMSILFSCGVNFVQGNFLQEPEKVMSYDFA